MIDCHLHVVPPRLPGVGLLNAALGGAPDQVAEALRRELRAADVHAALAVGSHANLPDDPLGVTATLAVAEHVPGLHAIGVMDPAPADPDHYHRVDRLLADGRVKGLKAYLGYLPYPPDHAGYRPYYELAERYRLPVVFHTGHTFSARAKLRFAGPLLVDDVAVDFPRVEFVLAGLGNPWLREAAEVVRKNLNVSADLAGLVVGDAAGFDDPARRDALADVRDGVAKAFRYAERPNRFLFGSGWPLVPIGPYRAFLAAAVPAVYHELVFEENAQRLFKI